MVISLGHLSPDTSCGLPAAQATRAGSRCLFGLAPTGGYRATSVTERAVGSYPTFSPLPLDKGRSVLCGPVRRLTAPRRYLAVCPVELGLSSAHPSNRCDATIGPAPDQVKATGGRSPRASGLRGSAGAPAAPGYPRAWAGCRAGRRARTPRRRQTPRFPAASNSAES